MSCQNLQTASLGPRPTSCKTTHKPMPGQRGPDLKLVGVSASRTKLQPNSNPGSPSHTHPQNSNLAHGRNPPLPPTQNPAEGPSLQTSLALNLDPASASSHLSAQIRHSFPQDITLVISPVTGLHSVTTNTPSPPCTNHSPSLLPPGLHPDRPDSLYLLQPGSPLPCTSFSPANPIAWIKHKPEDEVHVR